METPFVSFLVPTLNSARTLGECLRSIRAQDWPADRREIVVADAGSSDGTVGLARDAGAKVVPNGLRTGEAGKAAAAKAAAGDVFALVDSDNVLPDPGWLRRMVAPLADPGIAASEPLRYDARPSDPPLVRYFARLGMNDPFCLFVGNYDRECAVTGRWTELPVEAEDRGGHLDVRLRAGSPFPTIGANGFVVRRSALASARWDPYWFDVDILRDVAAASPDGTVRVAKVKTGIVHLYCATMDDFRRKQERRVRDFLAFRAERAPSGAGRGGGAPRAFSRGGEIRGGRAPRVPARAAGPARRAPQPRSRSVGAPRPRLPRHAPHLRRRGAPQGLRHAHRPGGPLRLAPMTT